MWGRLLALILGLKKYKRLFGKRTTGDQTGQSGQFLECRRFPTDFRCPKPFVCPTPSLRIEGIFQGLSVQDLRRQSRNEQAQRELGWEVAEDFWFCSTDRGTDFREKRHGFCSRNPFLPVPNIHAKSTPPPIPKSTPNFQTFFPMVSLGA